MTQLPQTTEHKGWRIAFIILSVFICIIMPLLSRDYGQTGDEWLQIEYGQHIWDYFTKGDQQALDYSQMSLQYKGQEFYGGFFDYLMNVVHHWMPNTPILTLRHFFNAITGALMILFTGLMAFRLSKKWSVAVVALLFIFFSPRIFGESMNNPKDIPYASGFMIGMYYFIAILQDFPARRWRYAIGLALGFGMAFGVRSAGGVLQLGYMGMFFLLYLFTHKEYRATLQANNNKLLKQIILVLVVGVAAGYIIGLSTWPWGLQSPISHPIESLKGMTNRVTNLPVLHGGHYYQSTHMPALYEFEWIFISNPLIVLSGFLIFIILIMQARKQYGSFTVIYVVFCAIFAILYMMYKKSTVYDSWRHVFFVYPFWVIMAAMGWDLLANYVKKQQLKWIPTAVAIAGLLPTMIWTVKSHPNQYVYFNELVGGLKGAYGRYETDYYQNSGLQDVQWILKNAKPIPGRKIIVMSNLSGFGRYFEKDTAWIGAGYLRYNERHAKPWDYYVTYSRYIPVAQLENGSWPPQNSVHIVSVNGVPLSAVIARKSTDGIAASEALQKNDFATAAEKYAAYLRYDTTDENVYINYGIALANLNQAQPAIAAINKAVQLNPDEPQYYDILTKLYNAIGDRQNAQQATSRMQELIMEQQERMGDQEEQ